jgi:hypothetical protein
MDAEVPDVQNQIQIARMRQEKNDADFCSIMSKISQSKMRFDEVAYIIVASSTIFPR